METKVFKKTFSNNALPLKGGVNRKKQFLLVIFKSVLTSGEEDSLPPVPVVVCVLQQRMLKIRELKNGEESIEYRFKWKIGDHYGDCYVGVEGERGICSDRYIFNNI